MDKGEIKAATIHEIGCRFEDMLEAAKAEESRNDGAKVALRIVAKKVLELQAHVDRDLDEGAFDNLEGSLVVASLIKKYVSRACAVLESGAVSAENLQFMSQGKSQAFQQMIENMKKLHGLEIEKVRQRQEAEAAVDSAQSRTTGVHPGATLKEQRSLENVQEVETKTEAPVPKLSAAAKRKLKKNASHA